MRHYNAKPIRLVLQPSTRLAMILAVAGMGACIIVVGMPMMLSLKFITCISAALCTAYFIVQDALLFLPWSLTCVNLDSNSELTVTDRRGTQTAVAVMPNTFVAAYLTVLNLRLDGYFWQRSIILTPDRADADTFRQLRVWLRWHNDEPKTRKNSGKNQNKTSAVSVDSDL